MNPSNMVANVFWDDFVMHASFFELGRLNANTFSAKVVSESAVKSYWNMAGLLTKMTTGTGVKYTPQKLCVPLSSMGIKAALIVLSNFVHVAQLGLGQYHQECVSQNRTSLFLVIIKEEFQSTTNDSSTVPGVHGSSRQPDFDKMVCSMSPTSYDICVPYLWAASFHKGPFWGHHDLVWTRSQATSHENGKWQCEHLLSWLCRAAAPGWTWAWGSFQLLGTEHTKVLVAQARRWRQRLQQDPWICGPEDSCGLSMTQWISTPFKIPAILAWEWWFKRLPTPEFRLPTHVKDLVEQILQQLLRRSWMATSAQLGIRRNPIWADWVLSNNDFPFYQDVVNKWRNEHLSSTFGDCWPSRELIRAWKTRLQMPARTSEDSRC